MSTGQDTTPAPDAPEPDQQDSSTSDPIAAEAVAADGNAPPLPEPQVDASASAATPVAQDPDDPTRGPAARVALVVATTLAAIGFVTGLTQPKQARVQDKADPTPASTVEVPPAPRYEALPKVNLGPNASWTNTLDKLPEQTPDLFAVLAPPSQAEKREGLAKRATRRAYAGAPPTIPHQVAARSAASCMLCHESGQRVGDQRASPMPHAFYVNCLQCHAPPPPPALSASQPGLEPSTFAGQPEPLGGERAGIGSPPVIPHATSMRETCVACHGPQANTSALRTTHPWRVNCRQCHAAATAGFAR